MQINYKFQTISGQIIIDSKKNLLTLTIGGLSYPLTQDDSIRLGQILQDAAYKSFAQTNEPTP